MPAGLRALLHHRPEQRLARAAGGRLCTLREWRALALWFDLGTIVCFADAAIAAARAAGCRRSRFTSAADRLPGAWRLVISRVASTGEREPVAAIDVGFVLAVVAFGWGLSLATYRACSPGTAAGRWGPGTSSGPALPIALGVLSSCWPLLFALARGYGGYGSAPRPFRCSAWPGPSSGRASCASARRAPCCWPRPRLLLLACWLAELAACADGPWPATLPRSRAVGERSKTPRQAGPSAL